MVEKVVLSLVEEEELVAVDIAGVVDGMVETWLMTLVMVDALDVGLEEARPEIVNGFEYWKVLGSESSSSLMP